MIKKLFLGSAALTLFSISIVLFQISCQKNVEADPPSGEYILPVATIDRLGGVKPDGLTILIDANGKISVAPEVTEKEDLILYSTGEGYWVCDKSGANKRKIQLPFDHHNVSNIQMLGDGNSVVFSYIDFPTYSVYTMNFDGSNLSQILGGTNEYIEMKAAAAFTK